jgi:hypothetical protein
MNNTRVIFASASFMGQYQLLDIAQNVLEAWPKLGCAKELLQWLTDHPDKDRVSLLDSGVFSTWSKGDIVDREEYAKFLLSENLFYAWVGLDKIPGSPGVIPNAAMVEASAQETWDNYMFLVDKGLDPTRIIPVFHQNEEMKWLEKLVQFNDEVVKSGRKDGLYIGISPANDRTSRQRILWLEECMPYLTNEDGSAKIRFHGFGATSTLFMHRYPWFTCDSTSWLRAGSFGAIRIPDFSLKYPHYDSTISVSMTERSAISQEDKHFLALDSTEKANIVAYIQKNGFALEQVAGDGKAGVIARQTMNLRYWKQLEAELNMMDNCWKHPQGRFI